MTKREVPPRTVVETKAFAQEAAGCLKEHELTAAIDMIAADPECGEMIQGTGGCRKVRFGAGGRGKSGGVRIVYLLAGRQKPIFLLTVFAKGEKANLTKAERNGLEKVARRIVATYGGIP